MKNRPFIGNSLELPAIEECKAFPHKFSFAIFHSYHFLNVKNLLTLSLTLTLMLTS